MTSPTDTLSPSAEAEPRPEINRRSDSDGPPRVPGVAWIVAHTDRLLPAAVVASCVIWLGVLQRFWWFADDFLYLSQSKGATPDIDFLRVSNYGHFAPITRFAYWFAANVLGLSHGLATVMAVIPLGLSVLLASLVIKELAPERPTLRWLVFLPMLTPFIYRVVPWWGASIHVMTGLMWSHLALWCWIRHLRTNNTRWLVGAQLALVGGLLTQERPMFVVGAFFLLEFITTPGNKPWHVRPYDVRRELQRWVPLLAIVALGLWNQVKFYPNALPSPSKREMVRYVYLAFVDYFLPGLAGARGGDVTWPALLLRWAVVILLAMLVVDVLRRRVGWWKAPLFFAATWLVHVGVVGAVKAGVRGAEGVAADGQYYVDATYLAIFSLVLALTQPLRAAPLSLPARRRRAVAGAVLVLVTIANVPTMVQKMDAEIPGLLTGGPYWERASESLKLTAGSDRRFLPLRVPNQIAPGFVAPFNEQSDLRRVFLDDDRTMEGRGDHLVGVDRDGLLREIAPEVIESGNLGATALEGRTATSGPVLTEDATQLCFDPAKTGGTVDLTLLTPLPAPRWPWGGGPAYDIPTYFAVKYESAAAGPIQGGAVVSGALDFITHPLSVVKGSGIAIARLDQDGEAQRVFLTGFSGRRACVSSYAVFRPVALPITPGSPCDRLGLGGEYEHDVPCPEARWDPDTILKGGTPSGGK